MANNRQGANSLRPAPVSERCGKIAEPVGTSPLRLEDLHLIRGEGRRTNNLSSDGACWFYVVRSRHAHAMLSGMNVDEARRRPGALAVLTAQHVRRSLRASLLQLIRTAPSIFLPADPAYPASRRVRF